MKQLTIVIGAVAIASVAIGCRKTSEPKDPQIDRSTRPAGKSRELADSSAGSSRQAGLSRATNDTSDVCALLAANEVTEITGLPIDRVEKKPDGCEWYAKAAAQQQQGADTARATFEKLTKEEPKSADEGVRTMENLLKGLGGAIAPDKPLFAVTVQRANADEGEATLKITMAVNGGGAPGGRLEPIEGLGDRAFIGALGTLFYVRKGAVLIMLGGMGTREQTIALARLIVPRIR